MKKTLTFCILLLAFCISLVFLTACGDDPCSHTYDNACDATCNECGVTREVQAHQWKDADCSLPKTCTVCGATEGEALGHEMTTPDVDMCEVQSTCSRCGATEGQNKEHTWVEANCTAPKTCSTCQKTEGTKLGHTPNKDDGDCTTAVLCSVCNTVMTEAKSAHTADEDDGDCTTAVLCLICNTVAIEAKSAHTPYEDDGDCTTALLCSVCNTVTTEAKSAHTPCEDDGDCTTAVLCSVCGTVTTEAKSAHTNENGNRYCDFCSYDFGYVYSSETFTYSIYTAEGLYAWAGHPAGDANAILMNDIVLSDELIFDVDGDGTNDSNWSPERTSFVFDGNGYAITGVIVNAPSNHFVGFFSSVDSPGVIKNLSLINVNIKGQTRVGGLTADNSGSILNCSVSGRIEAAGNDVAGIAGCNSGIIIACVNKASVYAENGNAAGIAGQVTSDAAGIVGCYNLGTISSPAINVGGIAAYYSTSEQIMACYNLGELEGTMCGEIVACASEDRLNSCYFANPNLYGIGSMDINGGSAIVDGYDLTWYMALSNMNIALERGAYEWRYALNNGDNARSEPLIIVAVTDDNYHVFE